jgi:hypothetical protein
VAVGWVIDRQLSRSQLPQALGTRATDTIGIRISPQDGLFEFLIEPAPFVLRITSHLAHL